MLSHSRSHQMIWSQVTRCMEGDRKFWKDDIIQCVQHVLTLWHIYGYLG